MNEQLLPNGPIKDFSDEEIDLSDLKAIVSMPAKQDAEKSAIPSVDKHATEMPLEQEPMFAQKRKGFSEKEIDVSNLKNLRAIPDKHDEKPPSINFIDKPAANLTPEQEAVFLHTLMDNLPDHIYFKDRQSRFIMINKAHAKNRFSLSDPKDAIGKTDFDFFSIEHAQQAFDDEQKIIKTGLPLLGIEEKETWPDGRVAWVLTSKLPMRDNKGNIIGTCGISRDITNQKLIQAELSNSEEQFHQAQKMEAFGQIAGGITHDFRNMLCVLSGHIQLLEKSVENKTEAVKKHFDIISNTTKQTSELIGQLLSFARKESSTMTEVDMNEIIRSVVSLLKHTIDKNILIVEHLNAQKQIISGNFVQLQNALLNMGLNARDAMPDGGTLTFETEVVSSQTSTDASQSEKPKTGEFFTVRIIDTGTGMDEQTCKRAFEPFFTTKGPGKGTGLGLASVFGIVKSHNGIIELQSKPGQGTTFTLFFPICENGSIADPVKIIEQNKRSTCKIMVIDSEASSRIKIDRILKDLEYNSIICTNSIEARNYYKSHFNEINIIIIDRIILMPQMGGYDLMDDLARINSDARIIIASGFSFQSDSQRIINKGVLGVIQKPYERKDVTEVLAKLLIK